MTTFNDFKGAAKRIDDVDIPLIGHQIGVGEDEIHAFMDVEAAGSGFDSQGRPKMLFEPHVFWRNLPVSKRDEAAKAGLAYPKWRAGKYPKDSYPRLLKAMEIDETAALKSASWGLGQILGENYRMVGYDTPQEMVRAFMDDEAEHLRAMIEFLKAAGIADDLKAHRWEVVARAYNGPAYARHNYHGKMKKRFEWWQTKRDTPIPKDVRMPRARPLRTQRLPGIAEQSRVYDLSMIQQQLRKLGYPQVGNVDGKWGRRTRDAVMAFRADQELKLPANLQEETLIDQEFLVALREARPRQESQDRQHATAHDLRDRPGIQFGQWFKIIGAVGSGLGIGGGALDAFTEDRGNQISTTIDNTVDTVTRVNGVVNTVLDIGPWIGMSILGVGALVLGYYAVRWGVHQYRTGRHV